MSSTISAVKIPPHSIEAEQAVIGGLMLDNDAWDQITDRLSEEDFYKTEHQLIYKAQMVLVTRHQPLDVLTISEYLKEIQQLDDAGGEIYLFELARSTPTAANIKAYADIVRERSILRQLLRVAGDIADSAFAPEGRLTTELLDDAERKVFAIAEQQHRGTGPVGISNIFETAMARVHELTRSKGGITGLSTGFVDLDNMTSGLQPADLIIVAGRPSMGKTIFGINIAETATLNGDKPVLVFSMEMPAEAIAMRLMSSLGSIEQSKIRNGDLGDGDWPRITGVLGQLSESKLFVDDTPALTPSEVRARARRLVREHGDLGLIVIDYLQLMRIGGRVENRTTEISEISRSLKALAKELNTPVIALSQLNRSLEQRSDRRPVMSDLRESGAIEQDADLILFIYRDEVYNPETSEKGKAEIIIGKQRNGPIGRIALTFKGALMRFDNFQDNRYAGLPQTALSHSEPYNLHERELLSS